MYNNAPGYSISDGLKPQNIVSCSLSALKKIDLTSESLKVYNIPVEHIEIYARTTEKIDSALRIELKLQDQSTSYSAFIFKKSPDETPKCLKNYEYIQNGYVHILASLRKNQEYLNVSVNFIENTTSRTEINEFYSRVILNYLKNIKKDFRQVIINAIKSLSPNGGSDGVTINNIAEFIGKSVSVNEIEETCSVMMGENTLTMGVDWNHYKLL